MYSTARPKQLSSHISRLVRILFSKTKIRDKIFMPLAAYNNERPRSITTFTHHAKKRHRFDYAAHDQASARGRGHDRRSFLHSSRRCLVRRNGPRPHDKHRPRPQLRPRHRPLRPFSCGQLPPQHGPSGGKRGWQRRGVGERRPRPHAQALRPLRNPCHQLQRHNRRLHSPQGPWMGHGRR